MRTSAGESLVPFSRRTSFSVTNLKGCWMLFVYSPCQLRMSDMTDRPTKCCVMVDLGKAIIDQYDQSLKPINHTWARSHWRPSAFRVIGFSESLRLERFYMYFTCIFHLRANAKKVSRPRAFTSWISDAPLVSETLCPSLTRQCLSYRGKGPSLAPATYNWLLICFSDSPIVPFWLTVAVLPFFLVLWFVTHVIRRILCDLSYLWSTYLARLKRKQKLPDFSQFRHRFRQ